MPLCCSLSQFFFFSSFREKQDRAKGRRERRRAVRRRALSETGKQEEERERERKREIQNTDVRASFSFCNVNAPVSFDPRSIPFRVLCVLCRENPIRFGCRVVCPCLLKFHNGSRDREIKERGASRYVIQ